MSACPSKVTLEQYLLTPNAVAARVHIEQCEDCAARLTELRRSNERFEQFVLPGLEASFVKSRVPRGSRLPRWLTFALPVVALGASLVLVLQRPRAPAPDYVGVKGPGLALEVFVESSEGASRLQEATPVARDARLRFSVAMSRPCWLWVLSVDAAGHVSRIFPSEGEGGRWIGKSGAVPGGGQLDGVPGPERFIALCGTASPLSWLDVERTVQRDFAPPGAGRVRLRREVSGLPASVLQATVAVEKEP